MTEDEIEAMAWDLEAKIMEIRKDPRAALTAGLDRVRAILLAELQTESAKVKAAMAKINAEYEAKIMEAVEAKMEAVEAKIEVEYAALMTELRDERLRYRQLNAAEAAEPNSCARPVQ